MPYILPVTWMGNTKIHNRDTSTQIIGYPCEGTNCQYCKQEAADPATQVTPVVPKKLPTVEPGQESAPAMKGK